jgi:Methyltransferase domain
VELGTHWGEAYFTFCQVVQENGLSSLCYAVDHWLGDEHAGHYGEEVFEDVRQYNERYYSQFSYLLRSSFDDAISQFGDASIGLLHIDGLHTYEAASHDFRTWLPKVKPGGIVLLHDICPKHEDFGVWRLWDEIKAEFPNSFEFHHSWGLGVVRKAGGTNSPPLLEGLFSDSPSVREEIRHRYVIYTSHVDRLLSESPDVTRETAVVANTDEVTVQVFPFGATGYSEDTSLFKKMKAGTWSTMVFELPDDLGQGPLRIDPVSKPGLVEIADIRIYARSSGDLVWDGRAPSNSESLVASGSSAFVPAADALLLVSFGDDPQLWLHLPPNMHGPLQLNISLRVTPTPDPAPQIVVSLVEGLLTAGQTSVEQVQAELAVAHLERDAAQLGRDAVQHERDAAQLERDKVASELSQAVSQEKLTQERLQAVEEKLRSAETVLVAMQQSLSWRITEPIRRLMATVRSGPRKQ